MLIIVNGTGSANIEIKNLQQEMSTLLTEKNKSARKKQAAQLGAAVLAGTCLFGIGFLVGNMGECGLIGTFGGSQNEGRKNAENIGRFHRYTSMLTDYVVELLQEEMVRIQTENWKIIEAQFVFEHNFVFEHKLFSNQQLNFNFDSVASLITLFFADVKSYRSALYAYKINLINSVAILLNRRLPMSLVPRESLVAILGSVHRSHRTARYRIMLAIPMTDLLSYYNAQLVERILLTLAILMSRQTAFNVYEAHRIPMPQADSSEALMWVTEVPYLAVSEDSMENAILKKNLTIVLAQLKTKYVTKVSQHK